MMDMTKRVKVAMMDYIADLTGAGASQTELKIAIEMSKTVMDAMRSSEQLKLKRTYCSPYFPTRMQAEEVLEKMRDMIDCCGYVTLDYLKHLAGKKSCSLYEHYGWDDLSSAHIEFGSNRCLYYIVLPELKCIKDQEDLSSNKFSTSSVSLLSNGFVTLPEFKNGKITGFGISPKEIK